MGATDRVTIELYVDDQGTIKIKEATAATRELSNAGAASADDLAASMVKTLGIYALVTAAAYKLEEAITGAFRAGIEEINSYNISAIAAAANLTNRSVVGIDQQKEAYGQYKTYVLEMYESLEAETAKHFSSGKDMINTFNALTRLGVMASQQEAGAIGVITDQIRLMNGGLLEGNSIQHEMYGVLMGYAGTHYRLAQDLTLRLGPGWHDLVVQHQKAGDLTAWIASLYPGLATATKDIQEQLTAQETTLETTLGIIGRSGLAGAYEDIVGTLKEIDGYLKAHGDEISGRIANGWRMIKDLAAGVLGFIKDIYAIVSVPVTWTINIVGLGAQFLASTNGIDLTQMGGMHEENFGQPKLSYPPGYGKPEGTFGGGEEWASALGEQLSNKAATPPPIKSPDYGGAGGGGGGGGKGAESEARRLMSMYDTLTKDIARLSEGSFAEIEANLAKTLDQIYNRQAQKAVSLVELDEMAHKRATLQKEKVEQDMWQKIAKESGDAFAQINRDYDDDLKKVGTNAALKEAIEWTRQKRVAELDYKQQTDLAELSKGSLSNLASVMPFQEEQVTLKRQALELEIAMSHATLDHKLAEMALTDEARKRAGLDPLLTEDLKTQLHYLQDMQDAAKRLNLTMEADKGLSGWAFARNKEVDQRNPVKDMLGGAESGFQSAFSSGLQGVLSKDKTSLLKIGQTMFQGLISSTNQSSIRSLFDSGAKMLSANMYHPAAAGAAGVDKAGAELGKAGQKLNLAGDHFSLNSAQFGLAAGGLALSGIGIMTHSQALVVAGTILQVAAMAIQIYEALTATTETTAAAALTTSAGALGVSATGLGTAATALSAAATALGTAAGADAGGGAGGIISGIMDFASNFLPFHSGAVVAHRGLAPDERLVLTQTGEPIFSRSAWGSLQRQGATFDMLNRGQLPKVPVPVGGSGGSAQGPGSPVQMTIHNNYQMTRAESDRLVRLHILPALERANASRGG